jgi:hypothetical protein
MQSAKEPCSRWRWTLLGAAAGGGIAAIPASLVAKRYNNEGADATAMTTYIIGVGAALGAFMGVGKCL